MIRLEDTSASAVSAAIAAERHRMGSPATGMVLTLLILADEEHQADATAAAVSAALQHPMRIVTLVPRPDHETARLDAEVAVGGDDGPGEVAVLRLRGPLAAHSTSVAIPLLLSDTPVVAYWPSDCPPAPAHSPVGRHAQRRITDLRTDPDIAAALRSRYEGYVPGDTDLAWARLTPWRSALAQLLDSHTAPVTGAAISAPPGNASAILLSAWLSTCLRVPAPVSPGPGPGITEVRLTSADGDLVVSRSDGEHGLLSRPGAPDSPVALRRRSLSDLLTEELRRMDPDEVYGMVLKAAALGIDRPAGFQGDAEVTA